MEHTFKELQEAVLYHTRGARSTTSASSDHLTEVKRSINAAYVDIFNSVKMMAQRVRGSVTLAEGKQDYAMPEDFQKIVDDLVWYETNKHVLLYQRPQDWSLDGGRGYANTGHPIIWHMGMYNPTLRRHIFRVEPSPSSSEVGNVIEFDYYRKPTEMSADADIPEIPDEYHHHLVHGAISESFQEMIDDRVFRFHVLKWEDAKRLVRLNSDRVMGRRTTLRAARRDRRSDGYERALRNFNLPDLP